jgi:hypothetical protein
MCQILTEISLEFVFKYAGECIVNPCPQICPAIYAPVCGKSIIDGSYRTFGNSCELGVANCPTLGENLLEI